MPVNNPTSIASQVIIPNGLGTPTYDDVQDFMNTTRSAGRLTGGAVTKGTGATVSITALDGMIFTGNTLGTSPLIYFKKAAQTSITPTGLTDGAVNWIYIDYDSGSLTYKATTTRSTIGEYTMFTVARVWVSGTTLEVQASGHSLYNKDRRSHNRLILKYSGMDRVSGGTLSALGILGQIQTDAGSWYIANTPFTTLAATTFFVWYKHEASAWTRTAALTLFSEVMTAAHTVYETYQDGTDLTALTGNNYGAWWVFLCPEGHMNIVLGTSTYANVGLAQASSVPSSLPPYLVNWSRLIGRVITKKGTVPLYSVESSFANTFTLSAATDHSSLANLSANDHTQYLLVADIDDAPVDTVTNAPISSNWAYDHTANAAAHHAVYTHPNHTGNVTSVADGATTIAAKAVTVAMLADGTDGQLITWDANAVAATVATGNAGQVLTSNGAGAAPTFQAVDVHSKSFMITNPTADADGPVWRAPVAITITAVHVLCIGGTSLTGQLWEYDANGANGAVVDSADIVASAGTNANDDGTLSNPSIDAGDYVGWKTTSISGTPTGVIITFEYTEN